MEGEALCVTHGLERAWPDRPAQWLSLDQQPIPLDGQGLTRRWLPLREGGRAVWCGVNRHVIHESMNDFHRSGVNSSGLEFATRLFNLRDVRFTGLRGPGDTHDASAGADVTRQVPAVIRRHQLS